MWFGVCFAGKLQGNLLSRTKTVYFFSGSRRNVLPPVLGGMWFKNGPVEPARSCCLAVWWPFVWGSDFVVLVRGCQDVTSRTVTENGLCEAARPRFYLVASKPWFRARFV